MKILVIANNAGGLYGFRKELINGLAENNTVGIAVPRGRHFEYFENRGYEIFETDIDRRGMNPFKDRALYAKYRKIIKEFEPDLIVTYTVKCNIYGGMAARRAKIPYAVNITGLGTAFERGGWLKKLVIAMYKIALKKVKVCFFENEGNRKVFTDNKIVPAEKCVVLPGAGVNLEEYPYLKYTSDSTCRFLFIGRIMKEKGVEELFSAARRCKEEGLDCRFDFIGGFEENYKDKIDEFQQEGILRYHGFQNDIKPFVADCDCVVLPSYHEGMSNALLESAAMGRALIASDIPGCREAVVAGENGFLCARKDAEDLYRRLSEFIALDPARKAEMGKSSRKLMEDRFDKRRVVAKTIEEMMP